MSIVSEHTKEEWERTGEWKGVPSYVDGVLLLWSEDEDEPLDEETFSRIYCGVEPARRVSFRFFRRDEDAGLWYLEESGDDHELRQRMRITVVEVPDA